MPYRATADAAVLAAQPPPLPEEEMVEHHDAPKDEASKKPVRKVAKKLVKKHEEEAVRRRGPHFVDIGACCDFLLGAAVDFWETGEAERVLGEATDGGEAAMLVAQAFADLVADEGSEGKIVRFPPLALSLGAGAFRWRPREDGGLP